MDLKKTPLHSVYGEYGAKTVEFGGWDMPVQFSGILTEHEAVRQRVGLFDVSHMGEFEVTGADARAFIQYMVTNDVSKMMPNSAVYSPMTYETGGCVDDLLVYCFSEQRFWIVVNAGNIQKDFEWLAKHSVNFDVLLKDYSNEVALLALQGPQAETLLQSLTSAELSGLSGFRFVESSVNGVNAVISRTGYTGEDGFELYVAAADATQLWRTLMEHGKDYGAEACGLGCRDTLRLEARLPLYGHELNEHITPLEAGLGMFVKLDKPDFIGRNALQKQKAEGLQRKIVGLQLLDRGIPRADYKVFDGEQEIGYVTSGTLSPTTKLPLGLAILELPYTTLGTPVTVDIRGKRVAAEVIKTPFYKRTK